MTRAGKRLLVVVRAQDPPRITEALRAALGMTLRGATVTVVTDHPESLDIGAAGPDAGRLIATLRSLGHTVQVGEPETVDALCRTSDAVEVWT